MSNTRRLTCGGDFGKRMKFPLQSELNVPIFLIWGPNLHFFCESASLYLDM